VEEDLQILHEATFSLLKRTGVRVDSLRALEYLAGAGVRVDSTAMRVYPEARHFEGALAAAPRFMTIHGRRPGQDRPVILGGDHANVMSGGASVRVLTVDGQYQPATWEHLRQFNVLLDALPNIHMHFNQVDPVDQAGPGFYKMLAAEMLTGCTKPLCLQAPTPGDVQAMIEMGAVIRGSRAALVKQPLFLIGLNAEPPLRISADVAEALILTCAAGLPVSIGHYAMMGVSGPVTAAGTVVQTNAVQVIAIILAQAIRCGTPICYTSFSGGADLRTLDVVTSSPHALQLLRLGIRMGRYYGLPTYSTIGTDARDADAQAACEMAVQLQVGFDAGAHVLQGPTSDMDRFMLSSFVQAVVDNDIAGYVLAARRQPSVCTTALALEEAHEVVTDPQYAQLKFASHEHTVRHMRDETWSPWAFSYENLSAWEKAGSTSVAARAAAKTRDILANHRPELLPKGIADSVRAHC